MSPHKNKKAAPRTFTSPLDGALFMATKGFRVFPLQPNAKKVYELDVCGAKHRPSPVASTSPQGTRSASEAGSTICPDINFGVHAGDGVIIDIDLKHERDGFDAYRRELRR